MEHFMLFILKINSLSLFILNTLSNFANVGCLVNRSYGLLRSADVVLNQGFFELVHEVEAPLLLLLEGHHAGLQHLSEVFIVPSHQHHFGIHLLAVVVTLLLGLHEMKLFKPFDLGQVRDVDFGLVSVNRV